jgi:hypothetical protein
VAEGVNGTVPNPSGCSTVTPLQLAQYTYYSDTIVGGFTPLTTAFNSADVGTDIAAPAIFTQDITGDGAAEYLQEDRALGATAFTVQQFGSTSGTTFSDAASGALLPQWITVLPNAQFHPAIYGDWLSNGLVNGITTPDGHNWSVYTPSTASGGFVGSPITVGTCQDPLSQGLALCDNGRAMDVDGDGLTDITLLPSSGLLAKYGPEPANPWGGGGALLAIDIAVRRLGAGATGLSLRRRYGRRWAGRYQPGAVD